MTKHRGGFPSEKDLKAMRKKLSKVKGSYPLPEGADIVDRTKYEICKQVVIILQKGNLTQRELAKMIGIPETRVSEIVHFHIHKFTLDKLLSYLERIKPDLTLRVA